eukprot:TRINITY_DN20173_c0_g1_i1.p1 TRINITY_DN20173_c0_g1~~TRINITY_DN20173_c0_g1_i1.p1  ORF type:complete len:118 (+),score=15.39 TRINITY_DN20173_c0_g1_i1:375-728(+)
MVRVCRCFTFSGREKKACRCETMKLKLKHDDNHNNNSLSKLYIIAPFIIAFVAEALIFWQDCGFNYIYFMNLAEAIVTFSSLLTQGEKHMAKMAMIIEDIYQYLSGRFANLTKRNYT